MATRKTTTELLVGVKDHDGRLIPSGYNCKTDCFHGEYDCKHRVAATTVGGFILFQAAVDFTNAAEQNFVERSRSRRHRPLPFEVACVVLSVRNCTVFLVDLVHDVHRLDESFLGSVFSFFNSRD